MKIEWKICVYAGIWTSDHQPYALASYPIDHWDTYQLRNKLLSHISIQDSREFNSILQFYFESNPTSGYFSNRSVGRYAYYLLKVSVFYGSRKLVTRKLMNAHFFILMSVAVAWSVEILSSNQAAAARVRFLGLGLCPLCSVLCCLRDGPVLITHSGRPAVM